MAKKHLPGTNAPSGITLPEPPDGKITKEMQETRTKTYQDLLEETGYGLKQAHSSGLISGINETAAQNHTGLVENLETIRDEPRGKWAQRHVEAFTEDVAKLDRQQQLGLSDAAGFKITETAERSISPDPKKPSWIERKLGGGS